MAATVLDIMADTLRGAVADAGRAAVVEVESQGDGGLVRLRPPAGSPSGCEPVEVEVTDGPEVNVCVRGQVLELTAGDLAGTRFGSEQSAVYEIARAVVEGRVSWSSFAAGRDRPPWKERLRFEMPHGPLEYTTDFGTKPLFALRTLEQRGRCRAYPA